MSKILRKNKCSRKNVKSKNNVKKHYKKTKTKITKLGKKIINLKSTNLKFNNT